MTLAIKREAGWLRRWLGPLGLALMLSGPALTLSPVADARVEDSSAYSKTQTFSGALRYLRVDLGYEITERDAEAAYLLFRYVPSGQKEPTHGSIEIIEADGRVKVYVQLPKMPEYHERVLSTGLMKKLRSEYGEPPKPEPDKKPKQGKKKREDEERPREGEEK